MYFIHFVVIKKNFSVFLNIKLIQIKEWLKLTLWMYAHKYLTGLSIHIVKSVLISDKVLYFYLLHDIYLANNLPPPPPLANLPKSVYISIYAHILLFSCIHVNKVCLWTILIDSLPILKQNLHNPALSHRVLQFPSW